ncbi:MAG: zf-TFIIB domain-containing protein [Acidobacteriota bacterium]
MSPEKSDGSHWDTESIRHEREDGWFRAHEAELIAAARRRRDEASARQAAASAPKQATRPLACPKCGSQMTADRIQDVEIDRCPTCEGLFFDRGELEQLLLQHEPHRRGFFRKLLGFHGE